MLCEQNETFPQLSRLNIKAYVKDLWRNARLTLA